MKGKCRKCYWYSLGANHCAIGYGPGFNCDEHFQIINQVFYDTLLSLYSGYKEFLEKTNEHYEWTEKVKLGDPGQVFSGQRY
ncbi:hypothetical protein ES702_01816 [subsurface metagenome]